MILQYNTQVRFLTKPKCQQKINHFLFINGKPKRKRKGRVLLQVLIKVDRLENAAKTSPTKAQNLSKMSLSWQKLNSSLFFFFFLFYLLVFRHAHNGSWTHNLILPLELIRRGGTSWVRAYWLVTQFISQYDWLIFKIDIRTECYKDKDNSRMRDRRNEETSINNSDCSSNFRTDVRMKPFP